ncbi:glutaminase [Shigella flexneri]
MPYILAEIVMEGLYGRSGEWAYRVGLPGKSGVGVAVSGGRPWCDGNPAFSPPLDEEGDSVRGQKWSHRSLATRL